MVLTSLYPDPPVPGDVNLHDFCFNRPDQQAWGDHICFADTHGTSYTVKQFKNRVLQGATALNTELGLLPGRGEVIGIMSLNNLDYPTLIHSCLASAIPFALFSHQSTRFELQHVWRISNATRIFVHPSLLAVALDAAKELGIDSGKIYILEGKGVSGHKSFEDILEASKGKPLVKVAPVIKSTIAYLVMSSGTSGLPKCVKISHHNVVYSMLQAVIPAAEALKLTGVRKWDTPQGVPVLIGCLPLSHSYGLHLGCFRTFLAPSTYVMVPKWNPQEVIKAIAKFRVTHLPLVPSLIVSIVSRPEILKGADLSSLSVVTSGAAYLPTEFAEKLPKALGKQVEISEGYGMSETTISAIIRPTVNGMLDGKARIVAGSAGLLLPGMKARIVKEDGTEADVNEPGELWLQGDNIALGYLNNPEATKETFVDGWLRTGDRFYVRKDGTYFFADRVKDTLKISGVQVSPVEIEDVLLAHPGKLISDVTVAGVSGGRTADEKVPRAWVVLSDKGKSVSGREVVKELQGWAEKNLSKYKWLRGGFEIVDEIPKSLNGKVLRKVLQEQYERTHLQAKL